MDNKYALASIISRPQCQLGGCKSVNQVDSFHTDPYHLVEEQVGTTLHRCDYVPS